MPYADGIHLNQIILSSRKYPHPPVPTKHYFSFYYLSLFLCPAFKYIPPLTSKQKGQSFDNRKASMD